MKIGTWILTILLAANVWAQSPAPKPQAASQPQAASKPQAAPKAQAAPQQSAAKPNVSSPAKTAAAAAKSPAPAAKSVKPAPAEKTAPVSRAAAEKPGVAKPANKSGKQVGHKQAKDKQAGDKQAKDKQAGDKQAKDAKESPDKTGAKAVSVHQGKRDPFVSPIVERKGAVCTGIGKRCLFIGDLNLIGIVESSNGVIAVVASGQHTYFLRENDPLADGDVERITSDAITLRQRTSDVLGRPVVKEVTRKIGMPAV